MVYYIKRDSLRVVSDAQAAQYARLLANAINHAVAWGDHTGCDCADREDHRYEARRVYEDGEWWVGHDGWWDGKR